MNNQLIEIKESLIAHLQSSLEINDFKYYQTTISVGDAAKGVVKFFKINKLDSSHNLDYQRYLVTVQVFIMFASNGADETENMMLDWASKLENSIKTIANVGLLIGDDSNETYVYQSNQCMGIKLSSRGIQFYSEEISATGRDRYEAWKGTVLAEYEFIYET